MDSLAGSGASYIATYAYALNRLAASPLGGYSYGDGAHVGPGSHRKSLNVVGAAHFQRMSALTGIFQCISNHFDVQHEGQDRIRAPMVSGARAWLTGMF